MIDITSTISIQKDAATVFDYFSNLSLDKHWRAEINETVAGERRVGATVTEDSFLSKKVPNHKVILTCVEYTPGSSIEYHGAPGNRFWLKSSRRVERISGSSSKIIYRIEFDPAVVKYGLGFSLPAFFVRYYTKATMNRYLKKLKLLLEEAK